MLKTLLSRNVPELSIENAVLETKAIFIDARSLEEYEVSHIKDAKHVGFKNPDFSSLDTIEKSSQIIVYCSVGYRSEKITQQLIKIGYTDIYNLYGGIFEWKNQGHEIVNHENKPTENVHAYNLVWGVWLNKGIKVYSK